jgi:hypothetical protein
MTPRECAQALIDEIIAHTETIIIAAVKAEREGCARVCEQYAMLCDEGAMRHAIEDERLIVRSGARASLRCAESIRNRNS